MYHVYTFFLLICFFTVHAADNNNWMNSINGKAITQENILACSTQLPYEIDIPHYSRSNEDDTFLKLCVLAHYARFHEIATKKKFRHVFMPEVVYAHLSGRSTEVLDENYVVWRRYVPDLVRLADMTQQERVIVRKAISLYALRELHAAVIYAGLRMHINKNLFINKQGKKVTYSINPLLEVSEQFNGTFYYQGGCGEEQYLHNVIDTLESMIFGRFKDEPRKESLTYGGLQEGKQIAVWKRLTQEHENLMALCRTYNRWPRFLPQPDTKVAETTFIGIDKNGASIVPEQV